jgi:hypothetical protein
MESHIGSMGSSLHSLLENIELQHNQLLRNFHHLTFRIDNAATDEHLIEFEDQHNQLLKKVHFLSFRFHEEEAEMKRLREENLALRGVISNYAHDQASHCPTSPETIDGTILGDAGPDISQ